MAKFDVLGDPPTIAKVAAMQGDAGSAYETFEKVWFLTPLPVIDLVVGAVAGGVDHLVNGGERERIEFVQGAVDRDWSATAAARDYVGKVRAQGRQLLKGEVDALEEQISRERAARYALSVGLGAVADFVKPRGV